jgi:hypothetical protein
MLGGSSGGPYAPTNTAVAFNSVTVTNLIVTDMATGATSTYCVSNGIPFRIVSTP